MPGYVLCQAYYPCEFIAYWRPLICPQTPIDSHSKPSQMRPPLMLSIQEYSYRYCNYAKANLLSACFGAFIASHERLLRMRPDRVLVILARCC